MKFKINNKTWTIKYKNQEDFSRFFGGEKVENYMWYGITIRSTQEIWINRGMNTEQEMQTLRHELMHCYLVSYISMKEITLDEELLCDIAANAHEFMGEVSTKWKEKMLSEVHSKPKGNKKKSKRIK